MIMNIWKIVLTKSLPLWFMKLNKTMRFLMKKIDFDASEQSGIELEAINEIIELQLDNEVLDNEVKNLANSSPS